MAANVTFIGSGNVAWHLAPALDNAGYPVREVFSRKKKNADELAARLYEASVVEDLDFSKSPSEIFIIAVLDDVLEQVVQELVLPDDAIIVHTSGANSIGELEYSASENMGVFYPLQTFSKSKQIDMEVVPIFIEAENEYTESVLAKMAKSISKKVLSASYQQRLVLHLSAVFANNFTNHCLRMAQDLMEHHELNFDLLKPLIAETLNKGIQIGPRNAQTGPAKRHDFLTLDKHLEIIEDEEMAELYRFISQHIVDTYPQG